MKKLITYSILVLCMLISATFAHGETILTPITELNTTDLYFVSLPYRNNVSWAIAKGGSNLQSSAELNITASSSDTRQQFMLQSLDSGATHYLYHPAEGKYINKDGSLSSSPVDAIYFKNGAYDKTLTPYFDDNHYINFDGDKINICAWGGSTWGCLDEGNSCSFSVVRSDNPDSTTHNDNMGVIPSYLPRAEYWYDYTGAGDKGVTEENYNDTHQYFAYTSGFSNQYKNVGYIYQVPRENNDITTRIGDLLLVEDVNGDGKMDFCIETGHNTYEGSGYYDVYISQPDGYKYECDFFIVPNFDVNNDGRIDYLKILSSGFSIMVQQADGSFVEQFMQTMTQAEYETSFDPEHWGSLNAKQSSGLLDGGGGFANLANMFSGASLARAPQRRAGENQQRAQGVTNKFSAPLCALDLNADGLIDLVNEKDGIIYYNVGDGKWVMSDISGSVVVADLNADGIQDFIYPGKKLQTAIYRGEGKFDVQLLYENIQVDPDIYCYDFDRDGDVDILVTFSAPLNSTSYAYTMFFENDGEGRFTQLEEQDYGDNALLFSNCQDIDGDGYYDMLAFRGKYSMYKDKVQCSKAETLDVVWLKGQVNKTFAQPEVLITYAAGEKGYYGFDNHRDMKINAEDIDNDGYVEVWASSDYKPFAQPGNENNIFNKKIVKVSGSANSAPSAPQKPDLLYNNGILIISWGEGSDVQTINSDLTYALRVGTTPGGNDILHAHANANGSRRNFIDGNMGKLHTYKLDLTSRVPSTIYVSVQAIDAQHMGSAWSEEAMVEHTAIFADFSLSCIELGVSQTLTATAYELPDGFTHSWQTEDGICNGSGHIVEIVFNTSGSKTITHTVTALDGTTAVAQEVVNVMPNYVATSFDDNGEKFNFLGNVVDGNSEIQSVANRLMADYNMDGYWDVFGATNTWCPSDYVNVISKGAENYTFTRASGIWNTGLIIEDGFWYDWNHNGVADILFYGENDNHKKEYYYLPHNGSTNLSAKKSDANIEALFTSAYSNDFYKNYFNDYVPFVHNAFVDFTHDGYYDVFVGDRDYNENTNSYYNYEYYLFTYQLDGSYQHKDISGSFDNVIMQYLLGLQANRGYKMQTFYADINRDGFTDACMLYYDEKSKTPFEGLVVMLNKGEGEFEQMTIPFAQAISSPETTGGDDMQYAHLVDMNNDGYLDIVAQRADAAIYVMYNEANQRFSVPEILPLGDLETFYFDRYLAGIHVADIDNNGFLDVISLQHDNSLGDNNGYGVYVHYFDATGVVMQGFVSFFTVSANEQLESVSINDVFKLPNHSWTVKTLIHIKESAYYTRTDLVYTPILGSANERPSIPSGVRAVQNADGLLIEWNDAHDDFTLTTQMRYNLSVKKKGATGAGAYIISPQNGVNSNAAPVRNYDYIDATQYLVPLSVLPVGEYEIQLQAIDLQGDWSDFSELITIAVQRESVIEAPSVVCKSDDVSLSYMGATSASTPEWNFDGAEIVSGSGYGPYLLSWNTIGTKTISVVVDGETYTRMLYVEENNISINFPSVVIDNMPIMVNIPDGMTANYFVVENDSQVPLTNSPYVSQKGNTLTFTAFANSSTKGLELAIELTNKNGCSSIVQKTVYIVKQSNLPTISLVTSNNEGHNIINWDVTSNQNFSQVRILKETNRYNQFVEIGIASITDGSFVDNSSNAALKSERYTIEPIMGDVELPRGTIHQTTHLTINRGLNDQTWNLIWNRYEGANVVSYNILRGSSADNMTQIASVSSSNTSYTDITPDASAPYYAIVYILADDVASAPRLHRAARNAKEGRSNVVNVANANKVVFAEKIAVLSANNKYETTAKQTMLLLYAEVMPVSATYQQVKWEIISGSDLATIDQNGLLTARSPNKGGTITVKATTIDGTYLTATRQIKIAAIKDNSNTETPIYFTVNFIDWDGTLLKSEEVEKGKPATAPAAPTREGYTFIGWNKDFSNVQSDLTIKALYEKNTDDKVYFTVNFIDWDGTLLKSEEVEKGKSATAPAAPTRKGYTFIGWDKDFSNVQSDLTIKALYEKNTAVDNIEEDEKLRPRKEMIDGIFYIIMPDGTKYTLTGAKVK